jgi:hypothetical protein
MLMAYEVQEVQMLHSMKGRGVFVFVFAVLGFKLRTYTLSTLALNCHPPDLHLLSS